MNNKKPILDKLRKRFSIYKKVNGKVDYEELPDDINKDSYPMLLYDFGRDEVVTVEKWKDLYDLSMRC